jgi:hypothetical protein
MWDVSQRIPDWSDGRHIYKNCNKSLRRGRNTLVSYPYTLLLLLLLLLLILLLLLLLLLLLVGWDWVHFVLRPLFGLMYQPQMIDDGDCRAIGGMKTDRGNPSTRRKPAPVPLCPPQIPHDLTWARTRAAAAGSQRLTAWAMARAYPYTLNEEDLGEYQFINLDTHTNLNHLRMETDPVSETSCFLVSRIPDDGKVQKPQ